MCPMHRFCVLCFMMVLNCVNNPGSSCHYVPLQQHRCCAADPIQRWRPFMLSLDRCNIFFKLKAFVKMKDNGDDPAYVDTDFLTSIQPSWYRQGIPSILASFFLILQLAFSFFDNPVGGTRASLWTCHWRANGWLFKASVVFCWDFCLCPLPSGLIHICLYCSLQCRFQRLFLL